jgi:hypothetical protein
VNVFAPDDGALAHATRDDRGVARHAATRGEHGAGGDDTVKVFRRRLVAHEDDRLSLGASCSAASGSNTARPAAAPRTRREAEADRPARA